MKYMHFNSSCSYAGLANMLEMHGYDTEDYIIALDMGLPLYIRYDGKTRYYKAGAMLQSKEWFELYLRPRGFCYIEKTVSRERTAEVLYPGMMLGIRLSPQSKHAVVFVKREGDRFIFINNKQNASDQDDTLYFTKGELLEKLPKDVVVGILERCAIKIPDLRPYYNESIATWKQLREELFENGLMEATPQRLQESRDRLFRPLLVDGLAMMKLLKQQELVIWLETIQKQYLSVFKRSQTVRLADEIDYSMIDKSIERIVEIVTAKMQDSQQN